MFGKIKEVVWLSKIPLSKDRENNIREHFIDKKWTLNIPTVQMNLMIYYNIFKDKEHLAMKII